MLCDSCGDQPAAVHLTQIVDETVTTLHLCETCAADKGVQTGATVAKFPLSDFLASMGKGGGTAPEPAERARCAACGATLQDFREAGRLGCPTCYDTFTSHLRDLLRRLHGASQHVGKRHVQNEASATGDGPTLADLRDRLRRAVEAENFELAAELRDWIRVKE